MFIEIKMNGNVMFINNTNRIKNDLMNGINPIQAELDEYLTEKEQFRSKYKNSGIGKALLLFYSTPIIEHKEKLHTIYNKIFKKLTAEDFGFISTAYISSIEDNIFKLNKSDSFQSLELLRKTLAYQIEQIDKRGEHRGFVWEIKASTGTTHYLLGTMHRGSKGMSVAPLYKKALDNCEQIATESVHEDEGERLALKQHWEISKDPVRYCIDAQLQFEARKKNKTLLQLDVGPKAILSLLPYDNKTIKQLSKSHYLGPNIHGDCGLIAAMLPVIEQFQNGQNAQNSDYNDEALVGPRNEKWLHEVNLQDKSGKIYKGLLELLADSKTPTCIVVGVAHCEHSSDERALVKAFEKAGHTVTRMSL